LHPRGRKKRIRFDFNSELHSLRPFPLQHDEPPKLASAVRSWRDSAQASPRRCDARHTTE
jgi:hypothetical protein